MTINTTQYQFAHGKKPRGYGLWIFDLRVGGETRQFSATGNYGDAVRKVKAQVAQSGISHMALRHATLHLGA